VLGQVDDSIAFFAVRGDADGLDRELQPTLDMTRKQARLAFNNTPARLIGSPQNAEQALRDTLDLAVNPSGRDGRGSPMLPGHERRIRQDQSPVRTADRIVLGHQAQVRRHAARRRIRPVGRLLRRLGAAAASDERPAVASLAKAYCSEAYYHAAAENIQIHGGIGFTCKHDAHLYFKRAKSSELLFGDADYHRELLVQRIGI
jgi:alkylation response protein AidB-like acyl-CoA dehydrogenase